jgi:hypothetical protein
MDNTKTHIYPDASDTVKTYETEYADESESETVVMVRGSLFVACLWVDCYFLEVNKYNKMLFVKPL